MKNTILFFALTFLYSCSAEPYNLWCFTGRWQELKCHMDKKLCVDDYHWTWDAIITSGQARPIPCRRIDEYY